MKTTCQLKLSFVYSLITLLSSCFLVSCGEHFLDAKPDKAILVPTASEHYEALLNNARDVMNRTPYLGEVSGDDFYMIANSFQSYQETIRNAYIWAERVYSTASISDWDLPYKQIFYANVVLDGLKDLSLGNERDKNLKGKALFYRAWALFQVAQLFAAPYDPANASEIKGVPVRLSADVTLPSHSGTLQDTYERMTADIQEAIPLLLVESLVPTQPSKTAAYALMARVQLIMQNYHQAAAYADSALVLQGELIDYNTLDPERTIPFPDLYSTTNRNPEVIFLSVLVSNSFLGSSNNTKVDSVLYKSYSDNDLRKVMFFNQDKIFRGSYMGQRFYQFSGLAVDEMLLIRSEAHARMGNTTAACNDLNRLLIKRWKKDTYEPVSIADSEELLSVVLGERRKELVARGVRWGDLKRLNQDARYEKIVKRNVAGKEYVLFPGDSRYSLPIPDSEKAY